MVHEADAAKVFWHTALQYPAHACPSTGRGRQQAGTVVRDAGFQISTAKQLNAAISKGKSGVPRCGPVFPDRYHAEIITSPRQARHALSYVMLN